jgi:methyltransferase-like protein/cyclopropane fatty-acyl-phospholipid synthase-like methyltransferase
MEVSDKTPYDEVSYPSFPISYTHPDRLATLASLFGMKPAPVDECRVLEIGCFDGANLAAMAMTLPRCEFVGVDAAGTAIARGRAMAEQVGLKNLTLRHLDVMEMAPDYGRFDYIVVHGLYTWVPKPVRSQIMAICKGSLAPQGVAYISYNTLPGGQTRLMLREMMLFHTRNFQDPQKKMQQASNLLNVLANSLAVASEPYVKFLQAEQDRMSSRWLESVYHDELSEVFTPVYFHQFMEEAHNCNLQFLGEADFFDMVPRGMTPLSMELLNRIDDDVILKEQYLDFMRGRHFRKTLLCHEGITLNRKLTSDCVRSYYVSTFAKSTSPNPNADKEAKETFENEHGATLTTAAPLGRALLWHLAENSPQRLPFPQLAAQVESHARQWLGYVPPPDADVAAEIAGFVWLGYRAGLLDLHVDAPPYITHVSEKPVASPLARWQARRSEYVATLNHKTLKLHSPIQRGLLALLDGGRDHSTLRNDVLEVFASGTLDLRNEKGEPIRDMNVVAKAIDEELEGFLNKAARAAVLMG